MTRDQRYLFLFYHVYLRFDCIQHHASAAPCMGLASKVGDIGVFTIFCAAEELLLGSHAALLLHWRLAIGACFFPLEYLLNIVTSDEWQRIVVSVACRSHDTLREKNPKVSIPMSARTIIYFLGQYSS